MNALLHWLSSGLSLGAVGAAIAFVVSAFQFLSVRKRESRQQEFDKYHWLIERLVQPDEKGVVFLDKQIAVVFELRHFPRYYECTERILTGLRAAWNQPEAFSRLLREIDLTIQYISERK
ncbi:MAG TPA: hypothetical protein VJP02_28475 [Candidatus Sulfotelmatobacter sp.]|nr:hypothetical protein [Candidatus Sulfotelmatobacter sp.]